MERRTFIKRAGLALGAVPAMGTTIAHAQAVPAATSVFDPGDWNSVRDQFPLTRSRIHMATFLLASHPRPVGDKIARLRHDFDVDPAAFWDKHRRTAELRVAEAAAAYLQGDAALIALTDSTTMGLGLVYGAFRLAPGQEILTTEHDHYSTLESLRLRAARTGARVRSIALYDDPAQASVDQIVGRMRASIADDTRVLAVTWVHSSTGVKLPIGEMARALWEINETRDAADRVLFCVDGVHGFGIEDVTIGDLGCDFFIAGTHKWLFGPRGTGIVYGSRAGWDALDVLIPSFGERVGVWRGSLPEETPLLTPGSLHTPGGFHSFEHRWSLDEAFRFHQEIGKARVQERIHRLNTLAKEALAALPHVRLYTPLSDRLSSGIIAFHVEGHTAPAVVAHLHERGITGSASPYRVSYPRIAPSLINDEQEVEKTVATIAEMR